MFHELNGYGIALMFSMNTHNIFQFIINVLLQFSPCLWRLYLCVSMKLSKCHKEYMEQQFLINMLFKLFLHLLSLVSASSWISQ